MSEAEHPKTVQVRDIQGKFYTTKPDELLKAARQCIREQFTNAAVIESPSHARDQIQILLGHYDYEVFYALWLTSRHQIIRCDELFRGTVDGASVYPRVVVKTALARNAVAVIFSHNHPSGCTTPSKADIEITKRLKDALALVDIRVLDHLVIGRDVTSMAELGLI